MEFAAFCDQLCSSDQH